MIVLFYFFPNCEEGLTFLQKNYTPKGRRRNKTCLSKNLFFRLL